MAFETAFEQPKSGLKQLCALKILKSPKSTSLGGSSGLDTAVSRQIAQLESAGPILHAD